MEPKFINQYKVTFEIYQDWANRPVGRKAVRNRRRGIHLRITLACLSVFIIAIGLLIQEFVYIICGLAFLTLALLRLFVLPNKYLKNQFHLVLRSQNRDIWINKFTFAEDILFESGNTTSRFAYSDIVKFTEDSGYFYLFYNEDMVLRICKDGFIVGTVNEFREFWNIMLSSPHANPA